MRLARVFGTIGRVLLTAGVLTLLFVVYQLWGTGIQEARAQNALAEEFGESLEDAAEDPIGPPGTGDVEDTHDADGEDADDAVAPPPEVEDGQAVARIEIPAIGVDKVVVEGVAVDDLKRGPGRFPGTPLPGQEGNAAIAGHRTTYGAPFYRLNELDDGDEIIVTTVQGEFRYEFREQLIVPPDQTEILEDHDDDRLTLVACHPRYSAAQRIVAVAGLADGQAALPASDSPADLREELPAEDAADTAAGPDDGTDEPDETAAPTTAGEDTGTESGSGEASASDGESSLGYTDLDGGAGLSLDDQAVWPAVLLGLLCAGIWLAAWLAARMVKPVAAYAVGTPLFLLSLFYFFENFSRFLPANF